MLFHLPDLFGRRWEIRVRLTQVAVRCRISYSYINDGVIN